MRARLLAPLLLAACTVSPDVSQYEPKSAADCPGQKACGWRCVDVDDPAAGCTADGCEPCPAGGAHTVAVCTAGATCGAACAAGFADCDGSPSDGCETPVASDAANCGACGRACADACVAGECQTPIATLVADSGEQPRGIAVAGADLVWVTDPPIVGGQDPAGVVYRAPIAGGAATATAGFTDGPGHGSWVTSAAGGALLVSGTELGSGYHYYDCWFLDPSDAAGTLRSICGWRDHPSFGVWGDFWTGFVEETYSDFYYEEVANPLSGGGASYYPDRTYTVTRGAGFFWVATTGGIYRISEGDADNAPDGVSGGGTYFDGLPVRPVPHRVAARSEATGLVKVLYFVDLTDGSVWTARTTGAGNAPWRLVRGDGPRSQMDVVADDDGAVWSDYDKGEIWAADASGQVYRVASGVRPWAIAITATTVYFTDVEAQAIRSATR
jgi:hypothetical protein